MAHPVRDDSPSRVIAVTSKATRRAPNSRTTPVAVLRDHTSTARQDEERQRQMRALIALGRDRGYLTHAEINDHLPDNCTQTAAMETIVRTFSDMGVAVYEQAPDTQTHLLNDAAATAAADDQADEEAEAAPSSVDSEFGRTTDPVRMYMREMGARQLLTRAGEIAIAKTYRKWPTGHDPGDCRVSLGRIHDPCRCGSHHGRRAAHRRTGRRHQRRHARQRIGPSGRRSCSASGHLRQ